MGKFYAVRRGHKTGIFTTWGDCKSQVDGFSGAEYKSFTTKSDAQTWLGGDTSSIRQTDAEVIAYVDGSYNIHDKRFSYGAVLIIGEREFTFSHAFDNKELASMRNVAGEIAGSEFAVSYCIENKIKSIDIYYDYEGIEKWANGAWKTNKNGTRAYAEFIKNAREHVDIRFVKVVGHSGDKYNDMADRLAKDALGIN